MCLGLKNRDFAKQLIKNAEELGAITLDLYGMKLLVLLTRLFGLVKLEELDLACNRLTGLPSGTGNLTNLRKLDLDLNKLGTLPGRIGDLKQLEYLSTAD